MREKAESLESEDQSVGSLLSAEFESLLQELIKEEGYDDSQAQTIRAIFEARLKEERNDTACSDLNQLSAKGWVAFQDCEGRNRLRIKMKFKLLLIYFLSLFRR